MEGDDSAAESTRVRLGSPRAERVTGRAQEDARERRYVDVGDDDDENTAAAAAGGRSSLLDPEARRELIVHHACT